MALYSLEIRNLMKSFGVLRAVNGISLAVQHGEIFGLLGPNGAGKTTTIQMICGLLHPDEGEIYLEGQPVRPGNRTVLRKVGVCTQQNIIWEKLTCLEQLEFIGTMYHLSTQESRRRGEMLLEQLGLSEKRSQLASKLSGGMQRRLNLALSLIHDPLLVVLDEPESGLDPQSRIMVREFIRSMARKKTVILTTHNMDEADRIADRVAIIDRGRLLVVDTPEDLKKTLGDGDVIELEISGITLEQAAGVVSAMDIKCSSADHILILRGYGLLDKLPEVLGALRTSGAGVGEARMRANTLEDVFISLTGRRLRE
jgi:ABC-2 type transport system ATP-binding protein